MVAGVVAVRICETIFCLFLCYCHVCNFWVVVADNVFVHCDRSFSNC